MKILCDDIEILIYRKLSPIESEVSFWGRCFNAIPNCNYDSGEMPDKYHMVVSHINNGDKCVKTVDLRCVEIIQGKKDLKYPFLHKYRSVQLRDFVMNMYVVDQSLLEGE